MSDSSSSHSIPGVATPSRSMTVISMLLMPPVHTLLQVLASSVRPAEAATAHGSRRAGPTPLGRRAPGHDICRSGLFPGGQPSDVVEIGRASCRERVWVAAAGDTDRKREGERTRASNEPEQGEGRTTA